MIGKKSREADIQALADNGHTVKKMGPGHYRVDGIFDLYPNNCRFHILGGLQSGMRGSFVGMTAEQTIKHLTKQGRAY